MHTVDIFCRKYENLFINDSLNKRTTHYTVLYLVYTASPGQPRSRPARDPRRREPRSRVLCKSVCMHIIL